MSHRPKHFSAWDTAFYLHTREETLKWVNRRRGKPARSRTVRFAEDHKFLGRILPCLVVLAVILLGLYSEDAPRDPDDVPGNPGLFMFMLASAYLLGLAWHLHVQRTKALRASQIVIAHERTAQLRRMVRTAQVEPAELLRMVERRRTWWRQWLPSNYGTGHDRFMCMSRVTVYALCAGPVVIALVFIEPSDTPGLGGVLFGLLVLFVLHTWGSINWFNRRLYRRMMKQQCPDCGYDATALVPAFTQENLKHLGPAQCSECGSPWPLVPPPAANTVKQPPEPDLLSRWETRCRALGLKAREKWSLWRG